mgnify:CR=1 FL=1
MMPDRPALLNPGMPTLNKMFDLISHKNTSGKRNNRALLDIAERAPEVGLEILELETLDMPIEPTQREDYIRANLLISESIKRAYAVYIDQEKLLQECIFWHSNGGTATNRSWGKLIAKNM